jgi:ketosteroid isomerase-like protein
MDVNGERESRSGSLSDKTSKPPEKAMKIRFLFAIAGLVFGFTLAVFAQEQRAVSPYVRQQIEAASVKFQEAYNSHDVAAIVALYTQDAVEVRAWQRVFCGQEAIEKRFADDFASSPGKLVNKLVQVYPIADDVCAMFDTQVGETLGDTVTVYVRHADGWKIRMTYVKY